MRAAIPGSGRRRARAGTAALAALVSVIALTSLPAARAATADDVKDAKERVEELDRQIELQRQRLDSLREQGATFVNRLSAAEGELQRLRADLRATQSELDRARSEFDAVRTRLNERAHAAFMAGPGSYAGLLLGATSLADLSDRIEFIGAVTSSDVDLTVQLQVAQTRLTTEQRSLQELRDQQAERVAGVRDDVRALNDRLAEQQVILDDIEAKQREAEEVAQTLSRQYQQQVASASTQPIGDGPIRICPVGQPLSFGDDFGAPRYSGGYHPHAGNDIFAPEGTPVYAPFDGYAFDASNTLGGSAVIVRGSNGYVYNGHLSRFGKLGDVQVGDVVGYVGGTGNAGGHPHDHFEWHPNVVPDSWPASGYGYSVVAGHAINPRPILLAVC